MLLVFHIINRFNSIKTIFNSTANTLCKPISFENFSELSAVLAVTAAATANINNENINNKEPIDDDIKMNDGCCIKLEYAFFRKY